MGNVCKEWDFTFENAVVGLKTVFFLYGGVLCKA